MLDDAGESLRQRVHQGRVGPGQQEYSTTFFTEALYSYQGFSLDHDNLDIISFLEYLFKFFKMVIIGKKEVAIAENGSDRIEQRRQHRGYSSG